MTEKVENECREPVVHKVLRRGYRGEIGSVSLGRFIVSNPAIHRGVPTFRGTCIRVTDVLHQLYQSVPRPEIVERFGGRITLDMLADVLELERRILEEERRCELVAMRRNSRSAVV